MNSLYDFINSYTNNGKCNDEIYQAFTAGTDSISLLKEHRDYIEQHKLGFGDRAFHYMWYLILKELQDKVSKIQALEIGVYKGQIISLWSMLSKELNIPADISAVTPLEGTVPTGTIFNNRVINKIRRIFSPAFRKAEKEGNLYLKENYRQIVSDLFRHFNISFDEVQLYQGYSSTAAVLEKISAKKFDVIYIDGDHSYEGAMNDIKNYSKLINPGGYMVMDDASWFLEGSAFWKGHQEVSRACDIIGNLGFANVINVGHNRVYKKI